MQVGDTAEELGRPAGWVGLNSLPQCRSPIGRIERSAHRGADGIEGGHPLVAQLVAAPPMGRDLNRFDASVCLLADQGIDLRCDGRAQGARRRSRWLSQRRQEGTGDEVKIEGLAALTLKPPFPVAATS
jgi:hypothetical protein